MSRIENILSLERTLLIVKCAKCQIRDAAPGSLYCSKCQKGFNGILDPLPHDYSTFEKFYNQKLKSISPNESLLILDDILMIYRYYTEFGIFDPVLGPNYREEHSKAEMYFYDLFSKIIEERLKAVGRKINLEELKSQFHKFRECLWYLDRQISEKPDKYLGIADIKPILLFFKKLLRSKNINMSTDFVDKLGYLIDPGCAAFILELFSELTSSSEDAVQKFVKIANELKKKYGRELLRRVVNFPVVLLKPWKHQEIAFDYWCKNNFRGIIEMATATGKTLVGLMAIQKLAADMENKNRRGYVLITSHSRAILNQWKQEVIDKLGLMAEYSDYKIPVSCDYVKIEFETIQSLIRLDEIKKVDLLIVDEVHHIAAPEFRKVLQKINYRQFMGLSASPDEGERANIFRSMGIQVVFRYGLNEAINDGVLPEFEWYLHPVYISEEEMEEFEKLSDQIRKGFYKVLEDGETEKFLEELGEEKDSLINLNDFVRLIEKARYKKLEIPESWKKLALLITQRRWLIHRSMPKIDEAIEIAKGYYSQGKKVIIFAMDINSCNYIAEKLSNEIENVFVIHSEISNPYDVLSSFKQRKDGILVGARMLDEGIDIPDAEVGLNVAASKTKIQLIQRLGRILRKYGDKKPVFHHFVGIPSERNFIEFEDPFWMLDEISWVLDTALSMGVNARIVEKDEVKKLIRQSEKKIKQYYDLKPVSLPSYGVLRLDRILSQFTERAIKRLINSLESMPKDKQITNEEWFKLIRDAFEDSKERAINVKGHWWILVLGDRNPLKIREIISNATMGNM
ncbi:hypothetical protein DRP04_04820 [Archaeoglobales archaeon]|nr:MAG: hypothetical protein DRP04_04820 [Archaeoglobales archaeon]